MIDLVKHAEKIRKKLSGISGVTAPDFSANTYFGVQPAPVTPANVIAERYTRQEPAPVVPPPYSLLQDRKTKSDLDYEAMNARTTRLAGDTRPLPSDAAFATANARTTTLTPNVAAKPNVLVNQAWYKNVMGPDGLPVPTFIPADQRNKAVDNPALNVLERKQQLAQIGARR